MSTVSVLRGFYFLSIALLLMFCVSELRAGDSPRAILRDYDLQQNFPNPFNPSTVIRYAIPVKSHVILTVHNLLGQVVATVVNQDEEAGFHEIRFDGSSLASGVYLYRLEAGKFVETRKLTLIR